MVTSESPACLVYIYHGYTASTTTYNTLKEAVEKIIPKSEVVVPKLPLTLFSCVSPDKIVNDCLSLIQQRWEALDADGKKSVRIILIGHSTGALIARKVYVSACGQNADAKFETEINEPVPREWAGNVERIILFAGLNRGWKMNPHLPIGYLFVYKILIAIGKIMTLFGLKPIAFKTSRGNPFITQLRLQTLSMLKHASEKKVGAALTIQLLGTKDGLVSPDDDVDLVTGNEFIYIEIPGSGHMDVIDMKPAWRYEKLKKVLTLSKEELKKDEVTISDNPEIVPNNNVTDVVFVVHGIRDTGYWTQKIARRVKSEGDKIPGRLYATETSSYGYFPMLPFLLYQDRQQKVNWLMDQYIENKAMYPEARFSFIGHSNGTYLLAKILKDYPSTQFKNVVLAGSVVPKNYDWTTLISEKRISSIYNIVATKDWVVGIFPKTVQTLRLSDLGSGGYDGFNCLPQAEQFEYIPGGHGAGVEEDTWEELTYITLHGKPSDPLKIPRSQRPAGMKILGNLGPLIFVFLILLVLGIGYLVFGITSMEPLRSIFIAIYVLAIWKVLTWF